MTANGLRQRRLSVLLLVSLATASAVYVYGCGPGNNRGFEEDDGELVDPMAILKKLPFDDWEKPDLVLLISGEQHGHLEPCGCAERQKGGLPRRHGLVKELRGRNWPVLGLDLGGIGSDRIGEQAEIKLEHALDAMRDLGYKALGLGPAEVHFGPLHLFTLFSADDSKPPTLVSANIRFFDGNSDSPAPWTVVEEGPWKIGVTSVFGKRYGLEGETPDLFWKDPAETLAAAAEQLRDTDLRVLLAYAPQEETEALLKEFPGFDLAVCTGGGDAGNDQPIFVGDTMLIQVGHKGMHVGLVGYFASEQKKLRYALVTMDEQWTETPEMQERLKLYQEELRERDVIGNLFEQPPRGDGEQPVSLARAHDSGAAFVGSEKCGQCHTKAYAKWEKSRHSKAFEDLEKVNHQYDPECVTCHTTGWQQQAVLPWKTGFRSKELTPHLVGNGCENCHGPGSLHLAAEQGTDTALKEKWRGAMRLDQAWAKDNLCSVKCHDLDNSPKFLFPKYWNEIAHPGTN